MTPRIPISFRIHEALCRGPRRGEDLMRLLGVSSATLHRGLSGVPDLIRMGRTRNTRYGLLGTLPGLEAAEAHPIHRVDRSGIPIHIGTLSAIRGGNFWYENHLQPDRSRDYDSLPWFLQDMRPQGFLGREIVDWFSRSQGWPADLNAWSDRHVLASLVIAQSHEHIGNLLVGRGALASFRAWAGRPIQPGFPADPVERANRYQRCVAAKNSDAFGSSSVGGEQPKFLATVDDGCAGPRHVLVKFSAAIASEAGRRWADLLRMEALGLEMVRNDLGIEAARARWMMCGERAFLEIDRFDRLDGNGRLGVISLTCLDAEYTGMGRGWSETVSRLVAAGQMVPESIRAVQLLELAGDLIGNNDRHLGNLSVSFEGVRPMLLTPIYDFLPMIYAPSTIHGIPKAPLSVGAETLERHLQASRGSLQPEDVRCAVSAATRFWARCADDDDLSEEMRQISMENVARIRALG